MKPNYGQDAPGLMRGFLIAALVLAILAASLWTLATAPWLHILGVVIGIASLYPLGMGTLMVVYSRVTKLADRDQMLEGLDWPNIRTVVDLGCGRGLLAIGAARRMTQGQVTGVDIWSVADQSGNTAEAAHRNAEIEGVAARVRFLTADMRALPMADASVDLILSAWAIHNLAQPADRAQALTEAVRVLIPKGRLVISDIACLDDYETFLSGLGCRTERRDFGRNRARILAAVSFGSFSPALLIAHRA